MIAYARRQKNLAILFVAVLALALGGFYVKNHHNGPNEQHKIDVVTQGTPAPPLNKFVEVFKTSLVSNDKGGQLPPTHQLIALARKWATTYWATSRCNTITYVYRKLPPRVIAQSQWFSQSLQSHHYYDCQIVFAPDRIRAGFSLYCAAVVHEFGHLHGFHEDGGPYHGQHSSSPHNIMYPVLTNANIPKTCKKKSGPFLESPPP